jgi:hypothetical protein
MLNKVLKTLNIWFNTNILSLNFTKTENIIFTAKKFYEQDNHIKIAYGNKGLLTKNIKIRIYKTIILPVVLYGSETWSLTLREEHRLRVFEN